jgi:hypothetical protein
MNFMRGKNSYLVGIIYIVLLAIIFLYGAFSAGLIILP